MKFWFLAGCGGHWLMFLVRSLKANALEDVTVYTDGFHSMVPNAGPDVSVTHNINDAQESFTATASFNVYLNLMKKAKMNLDGILFDTRPTVEQFEIMASAAACTLADSQTSGNLNFENIFNDQDMFINDLFCILDKHGVQYYKNRDIAKQAIMVYQRTCVDPVGYYNNVNNIWWLGWCIGIEKYLTNTWPLIYSLEQAQEFVLLKEEFYTTYTKDKVLLFNER